VRWNSDLLYQKAKLYFERANECDHERHEFPLWSSLGLELLARAALTRVHPVLNADPSQLENILYACGIEGTQQPKSVAFHSVLIRLEKVVPGFEKPHRELCDYLALLRNDELHSADLPYEGLAESKWLPRFYEVCRLLTTFLGRDLDDLLGPDLARAANRLIKALLKEAAKAVRGRIAKHAKTFSALPSEERASLATTAAVKAALLAPLAPGATAVDCPACRSRAIMRGELIKEMKPRYADEMLLVGLEFLATSLKCVACGLDLNNIEEVHHAGLEPRFLGQRSTDVHELYESDYEGDYMNM
jgi:hypothetical protein